MSVGFCTASITFAMVKVLPEPVTPSSTWSRSSERTPAVSSEIAPGWSPFGSYSDTTRSWRVCGLAGCFSGMNSTGEAGRSRVWDIPHRWGILPVPSRGLAFSDREHVALQVGGTRDAQEGDTRVVGQRYGGV